MQKEPPPPVSITTTVTTVRGQNRMKYHHCKDMSRALSFNNGFRVKVRTGFRFRVGTTSVLSVCVGVWVYINMKCMRRMKVRISSSSLSCCLRPKQPLNDSVCVCGFFKVKRKCRSTQWWCSKQQSSFFTFSGLEVETIRLMWSKSCSSFRAANGRFLTNSRPLVAAELKEFSF